MILTTGAHEHKHTPHACIHVRLTEKVFSSICLIVGVLWEVVYLLTHTSECSCRGETLISSDCSTGVS